MPVLRLVSFVLLFAALLLLSTCCLPTRIQYGIRFTPDYLWETDLRPLGYYLDEHSPPGVITAVRQIAFGDDSELVVISDQGAPPKKPNPARAFVLEAATGSVVRQVDWVSSGWPYIFPTAGGRYIANTSDGLRLYSHGLEEILGSHERSAKHASPDGRVITTWSGVPGRAVTAFLDADTLEPTRAEFINRAVDSVAFNRIVYTAYHKKSPHPSVFVDDATQDFEAYDTDCDEVRPRFVSQNVLAVFGCRRLTVVSVSGKVLFTDAISAADRWVAPASRNGRRFAVISTYESAAHWPRTCFERVRVYDVETGHVSFRAEIRACGGSYGGSGMAISPNGRLLAVNSEGLVRVFRLPELPVLSGTATSGDRPLGISGQAARPGG